jgi:membrane protease YdiL (CAAX protease family)
MNATPWPAIHGAVLLALLGGFYFWLAPVWPWVWLVPLAAYASLVLLIPPLRLSFSGLSLGRLDKVGILSALLLSGVTSAALLAYHALVGPEVKTLAASLPVAAFGNAVIAWLSFSIVNALSEELVFRGVLFHAVAGEWGAAVAVGGTALVFGLGHLQGYPPGPLGAALAGVYGVALGLLRWWTDGLALPIGCHVCADATIFGILVS